MGTMALSKKQIESLMLVISLIGLLNCISRADYNFPIFAMFFLVFFNIPDDFFPKPDHDHKALKSGKLCQICYPDGVEGHHGKTLTEAEIDFYNHEASFSPIFHAKLMMKSRRFRQQRNMVAFMAITLIVDLLWLLYWPLKWFGRTFRDNQGWASYQHGYVLVMSLINFIIKVLLLVMLLVPSRFRTSLTTCCKGEDEIDEIEVRMYHQTPEQGKAYDYYPVPTNEQLIERGYKDLPSNKY